MTSTTNKVMLMLKKKIRFDDSAHDGGHGDFFDFYYLIISPLLSFTACKSLR